MDRMVRVGVGVVVALALVLPAVASGKAHPLVGAWRAVAFAVKGERKPLPPTVGMAMEFRAGGKFIATLSEDGKSETDEGTWKTEGAKLTTVIKGKSETITFELKGKELRLTTPAGPVVILERPAP